MFNKLTDALDFSSKALKLRAKRQEALSANIANADTPNYKAVDFKFADALKRATGDKKIDYSPPSDLRTLKNTHEGHIAGSMNGLATGSGLSTAAELQFRRDVRATLDDNTVDIEVERAAFAENTIKYEYALKSINGRLSSLKQAMDAQR